MLSYPLTFLVFKFARRLIYHVIVNQTLAKRISTGIIPNDFVTFWTSLVAPRHIENKMLFCHRILDENLDGICFPGLVGSIYMAFMSESSVHGYLLHVLL